MPLENRKQIIIIAGAVIAGVVAVFLTSNYVRVSIQKQTATLAEHYDAKQKAAMGQLEQKSAMQMAALAQELQRVKTEQAQDTKRQIDSMKAALEQAEARARQPVVVAPVKVRKPSLALKTPAGKRAVTVMISSLEAVGGLLNPGDFVDVIAQLSVPAQDVDKKNVTAMIFQGLQVLAINTNLDDPGAYDDQQAAPALKITLAVDPQEAGLLSFANKNGSIQLALRSPDETEHQMVKASTWKTLADYVMKNQGVNIQDPDGENANAKPIENNKPAIQIYRAGKEL